MPSALQPGRDLVAIAATPIAPGRLCCDPACAATSRQPCSRALRGRAHWGLLEDLGHADGVQVQSGPQTLQVAVTVCCHLVAISVKLEVRLSPGICSGCWASTPFPGQLLQGHPRFRLPPRTVLPSLSTSYLWGLRVCCQAGVSPGHGTDPKDMAFRGVGERQCPSSS